MSINVMNLVWSHSQHKETNLLAMLAIADMANHDGFCWPGHDLLAQRCRCNRRNIIYVINKLESSGELYVSRTRGRTKSNRYLITIGMNEVTLAEKLTAYFELLPHDAVSEAKNHLEKCATGSKNVQQPAHFKNNDNVQQPAHFSRENVQPGAQNVQPPALFNNKNVQAVAHDPSLDDPSLEPSIINDHLRKNVQQPAHFSKSDLPPGKFLRTIIEDAGFVYFDRNFNEVAARLESTYNTEQLIRATQQAKEAHQKKVSSGERGITAPLAYISSILSVNGNGQHPGVVAEPKSKKVVINNQYTGQMEERIAK